MRLRFRFTKLGKVRWTSHRDVARMWERAFRRVELPLAVSQGFSPRPKVSFGLALPTGAESVAEYLDAELLAGAAPDLQGLPFQLSAALPVGVDVLALGVVEDGAPSLQHEVTSCSWTIELPAPAPPDLGQRVAAALDRASLVILRERKGKQAEEDIRPGILSCQLTGSSLVAELATQPRALRPSELLRALGVAPEGTGARRTAQWTERDGAREEPLALLPDATSAPHAIERAS